MANLIPRNIMVERVRRVPKHGNKLFPLSMVSKEVVPREVWEDSLDPHNRNRYRIIGYACEGGIYRDFESKTYGSVTFDDIYMRRPSGCRYCVAREVTVTTSVFVFDMFDIINVVRELNTHTLPLGYRVFDNEDAAIMYATMAVDTN